jgi:hypothetical protein
LSVARTSRRDRRFRTYVPLHVTTKDGACHAIVPRDISASGCYFDYKNAGFNAGETECKVKIIFDDGSPLEFDATSKQLDPGFRVTWTLNAEDSARLHAFLLKKSSEPSTYAKAAYINWEQRNICVMLRDIEDRKHKAYTFLYAIVGAYFVYLAAPLHLFTPSTPQHVGVYALGGIWVSLIMLYHSMRFFSWLGSITRQRAFLYHALETNRSWIFANDGSYYAKTVYPLGTRYDETRVSQDRPFALDIKSNWASPLFQCGIQALFAIGLVLFISIGLCAMRDPDHINDSFKATVFSNQCFRATLVGLVGLPLCWINFWGNTTSRYHKYIWEARRISPQRPNPKFPENVLKKDLPPVHIIFTTLQWLIVTYAILALVLLFADLRSLLDSRYLRLATWLVPLIFWVGKVASTMLQVWWMSSSKGRWCRKWLQRFGVTAAEVLVPEA